MKGRAAGALMWHALLLSVARVTMTLAFTPPACGQCPPPYEPPCMQFPAPDGTSMSEYHEWIANISEWRTETLRRYRFDDRVYHLPRLEWTQSAYIAPQMHPFDRFFYDPAVGYTVQQWVDDVDERYGGVDAILLWPTYPNLGVDDRNQFDWFRSLPGGLEGLRNVTAELKRRNIRVMLPYNPWDVGTRRENVSDPEAVARTLLAAGAEGINGDTMVTIPESFFTAGRQLGLDIALQPEISGLPDSMNWTTMGWGYWSYPTAPCVDSIKWLESRRLTSVCNRWAKNKTDDVQNAFVNGVGYVPWENVWGTWNGITPRGAALIHRAAAILRFFGPILRAGTWLPRYPCLQALCYSGRWLRPEAGNESSTTLLTLLVNRGPSPIEGVLFELPPTVSLVDSDVVDCYRGTAAAVLEERGAMFVAGALESWGLGCIAVRPKRKSDSDGTWSAFLATMRNLSSQPLASYSDQWEPLQQTMHYMLPTPRPPSAPENMTYIPAGNYNFTCRGVEIEGPPGFGVDFQFPWETFPTRHHSVMLKFNAFYIDTFLVTNAQWEEYVAMSGYAPHDPHNYLRFWGNGTTFPPGTAKVPVTWISWAEAEGYCRAYGKRLPHAWEWQYAAQSGDGRIYPWGDSVVEGAMPPVSSENDMPMPPEVDAFPAGASPFGVEGMVGIVYQWTDVFEDDHTRAALVKGGSYYRPSGSGWYYPHARQVAEHNKYLMMSDSYDRAGTIGFRCVVDGY